MKTRQDPSTKPYYRCLVCPRFRKICGGRPTRDMDLLNWCEYICDIMDSAHMTIAYVAEKADVSIKTIERIRSLNTDQDIMRETARRIEDAIIGSSNQYPCILAFEESAPENTQKLNDALRDLEQALAHNNNYRSMLDNIHASYNAEMQLIRDDAQRKIEFLVNEVEQLRKDNANLWAENNRKSKIVDMFIERQSEK